VREVCVSIRNLIRQFLDIIPAPHHVPGKGPHTPEMSSPLPRLNGEGAFTDGAQVDMFGSNETRQSGRGRRDLYLEIWVTNTGAGGDGSLVVFLAVPWRSIFLE